jgi:hypothetical protein
MYSKRSEPPSRWPERHPHAGPEELAAAAAEPGSGRALDAQETEDVDVPPKLLLAFAPLHKRALGLALGTACALIMFAVTAVNLLFVRPRDALNLYLLGQYFYGYTVSWRGAFIGAWWGFFTGFVAGWFLAFGRNFALALSLFITRTRAELRETRDFLDHI